MKILVTGGAGFIGSAVIRYIMHQTAHTVINVDSLTYAANLLSLADVIDHPRYIFEKVDICDKANLVRIFCQHQPDAVMHLAAESHVDRSIAQADVFIQTNIIGTYNLLEVARDYWERCTLAKKAQFRFHHISTDEVFGDAVENANLSTEMTAYSPSSPYSASKAAADHLVSAWHRTYGLPTVISYSSNNYGYFQHPEKLIPKVILSALQGKTIPIYGKGNQIRDWLFVDDHVRALYLVLTRGEIGERYNISGGNSQTNLALVTEICQILNYAKLAGELECYQQEIDLIEDFCDLIVHVEDRLGHDQCYAMDSRKIQQHLNWQPQYDFAVGLNQTVHWYLTHKKWWKQFLN